MDKGAVFLWTPTTIPRIPIHKAMVQASPVEVLWAMPRAMEAMEAMEATEEVEMAEVGEVDMMGVVDVMRVGAVSVAVLWCG